MWWHREPPGATRQPSAAKLSPWPGEGPRAFEPAAAPRPDRCWFAGDDHAGQLGQYVVDRAFVPRLVAAPSSTAAGPEPVILCDRHAARVWAEPWSWLERQELARQLARQKALAGGAA